jgi:hypothetical protein
MSPHLRKQLVLELVVWIMLLELITLLPSGLLLWKALPLNHQVPDATTELCAQHLGWTGQQTPICSRRKGWRGHGRRATIGLEQPHMEDVMDASPGWQL